MTDTPQLTWQAAELAAPVDQSGALPLHVPTLQYLAPEERQQYARTRDGTFRLAWVVDGDAATLNAAVAEIAAGRVAVFPPGDSPALAAEREAERKAGEATVTRYLEEADAEQEAAKRAALLAKYAKARAALDAQFKGSPVSEAMAEQLAAIEREIARSQR